MNHSPTPWHIYRHDASLTDVADGDGCVIAECAGYDDAEFIALACNAYDDLLAACEAALEASHDPIVEQILLNALIRARGESPDVDQEYEAMIADVGLHGENASPKARGEK